MQVLELFSGTHSVGKICDTLKWNVISLDRDLEADIQEDIMTWDYTVFEPGFFDIIWASPVCTYWSSMRRLRVAFEVIEEDIRTIGRPMVDKVREIINYFKPKYYFIENPRDGRMKEYITDLPYYDVDYCQYDFDYKKATRIWTNLTGFIPQRCNRNTCKKMVKLGERNIHKNQLGNNYKVLHNKTTLKERYMIPPDLIKGLFKCII
jgi:hypothetical protein